MLALALAATLLIQPQSPPPNAGPGNERFGPWTLSTRVDAISDEVTMVGHVGTAADNFVIACLKDDPASTIVLWRSSTRFRATGFVPRTGDEVRLYGLPAGRVTYRFDQDAPVEAWIFGREDFKVPFGQDDIQTITGRIATTSRLVLRDSLNEAHTVVFNLAAADTARMLQRIYQVCGTNFASPAST